MPADFSFVPSIVSALSGLSGVWLGGYLTSKREAQKESARTKAETAYLAVLVGAHLDKFVDRCIAVSFDDGTYEGRPAGDDGIGHAVTENPPVFDPLSLSVEWKSLPPDLMYGILNLPYEVEQLNQSIAPIAEYDFPDYSEYFYERQARFAELGMKVWELNSRLRSYAALPAPTGTNGFSRDVVLAERIAKVRGRLVTHTRQMEELENS